MASLLVTPQQYRRLQEFLRKSRGKPALYDAIVNAPFADKLLAATLDLGIVALLFVNKKQKTIDIIALSDTELALGATKVSAQPFHAIRIPLGTKENLINRAISDQELQLTEDWNELFAPVFTPDEARLNQAAASIEASLVTPLETPGGAALVFDFYQPAQYIGADHHNFVRRYAALVSEALTSKK